jgi:hypothetical protein
VAFLKRAVSKRAAEKDRELRELYLQQGAIPRNVPNKVEQTSAPPVKESSAPPLKTVIGQTEEKRKSDRKKSKKVGKNVSKKQPKKGELDLDDLRKNKEINKIVENFTGGALDSFTGGALVCSTLLGTFSESHPVVNTAPAIHDLFRQPFLIHLKTIVLFLF